MTRTSRNNGLECLVLPDDNFFSCPKNVVTFGAESVCFFSQPYEFITGNKMYYCIRKNSTDLSIEQCLFLQVAFTSSLEGTEYGYGIGLTGTRLSKRKIYLPLSDDKIPNWKYMEQYIINIMAEIRVPKIIPVGNSEINITQKKYKSFAIGNLFKIKRGNSGAKNTLKPGKTLLIAARKIQNGFDSFVEKRNSSTVFSNAIAINNNGDGGAGIAHYHPYEFVATQDVTVLISKNEIGKLSKLYIAQAITNQRKNMSFGFGNKLNSKKLEKLQIMLPATDEGTPDWQFMEDYIRSISNSNLI
ncbi:TPA: restriction endonuclease subunit S [Listeria monocytogenes]|nr:restriction endonuclease subunit S [Listeria monocytogenes]HDT8760888.1 restriction endonuclease subunit S [Listeria monocytogenes]HDU0122912.1 restriction endonuclease subunit S [Listeria monocytogenes]HDU0739067.1 restriction endonuclease subunit S [Listeria monocytogenes]